MSFYQFDPKPQPRDSLPGVRQSSQNSPSYGFRPYSVHLNPMIVPAHPVPVVPMQHYVSQKERQQPQPYNSFDTLVHQVHTTMDGIRDLQGHVHASLLEANEVIRKLEQKSDAQITQVGRYTRKSTITQVSIFDQMSKRIKDMENKLVHVLGSEERKYVMERFPAVEHMVGGMWERQQDPVVVEEMQPQQNIYTVRSDVEPYHARQNEPENHNDIIFSSERLSENLDAVSRERKKHHSNSTVYTSQMAPVTSSHSSTFSFGGDYRQGDDSRLKIKVFQQKQTPEIVNRLTEAQEQYIKEESDGEQSLNAAFLASPKFHASETLPYASSHSSPKTSMEVKAELSMLQSQSSTPTLSQRARLPSRIVGLPKPITAVPITKKRKQSEKKGRGPPAKKRRGKSLLAFAEVFWPPLTEEKLKVECQICNRWFHCGCIGLNDAESDPENELFRFHCPICVTSKKAVPISASENLDCHRPDCDKHFTAEEFVVGRVLARRRIGLEKSDWLVEWAGYPVYEATWECDEKTFSRHIKKFLNSDLVHNVGPHCVSIVKDAMSSVPPKLINELIWTLKSPA